MANLYLCGLSLKDPGINISLRTRQAVAHVMKTLHERTQMLHFCGFIEDDDAQVVCI